MQIRKTFPVIRLRTLTFDLLFAYVLMSPIIKIHIPHTYATAPEMLLLPSIFLTIVAMSYYYIPLRMEVLLLFGYMAVVIVSQALVPRAFIADTLLRVIRLLSITMPFFLAAMIKPKKSELALLFRISLLSLGASVLLGSLGFVVGWDIFLSNKTFYYGNGIAQRAGGIFKDSGQYGFTVGAWFTLTWVYYLCTKRKGVSSYVFLIVTIALTVLAIYASMSRVAMMMVAVALVLAPFISGKLSVAVVRRYWIAVAVGIAIIPSTLIISGADSLALLHRVLTGTISKLLVSPDSALSGRLAIWGGYLPLFWKSPLVGIGYKSLILAHATPPDNSYLGALVETGLLGAFFFVMFNLIALLKIWRMARYFIRSWWVSAIALLWLEVILAALTADVFTYWGVTPVLMVLLGGTLSAIRGER